MAVLSLRAHAQAARGVERVLLSLERAVASAGRDDAGASARRQRWLVAVRFIKSEFDAYPVEIRAR